MSQVFIFPGLNALLRKTDRVRFLNLPSVKTYLKNAEVIIEDYFHLTISFADFLNKTTEFIYAVDHIRFTAIAICAIQTALAEDLAKTLGRQPDWLMGCSLGDLARTVYAQALSFEDSVIHHMKFTQSIQGLDQIGKNIGVLAPKTSPFTDEDYQWFSDIAVDVSCLTPRFLNIGGRFCDLQKIEARAKERSWNTVTILEYPAHSRYILPYVETFRSDFKSSVHIQDAKIPLFSSLSASPLSSPTKIRDEFLMSITQPIHWYRAIHKLCHDHGVSEFINIGPCRSLTGLMRDIPVQATTREAYEIL